MGPVYSATPLQIRDRKIKDLQVQLSNEKQAHRHDTQTRDEENKACRQKEKEHVARIQKFGRIVSTLWKRHDALKIKYNEQKKRIDELEDTLAVYKGRAKKDSSNSSKPPSTDGLKKKVRTLSTRTPSGKRPGGQPGHAGHALKARLGATEIIEIKDGRCACGGEIHYNAKPRIRSATDIEIVVRTQEMHIYDGICACCAKPFTAHFPEAFPAPRSYGPNIRTLCALLNEYGNVPDHKTADIISSICANEISMSSGTVVNIRAELANKLQATAQKIKQWLIATEVLGVDETGVRVNGKLGWTAIYVNDQCSYYTYNAQRSAHCSDKEGVLAYFTGILVHDHFKAYYKNKAATHAECNQHILRYLKAVTEILAHPWAKEMSEFLRKANERKKELIADEVTAMAPEEFTTFSQTFTDILERGHSEYQAAIEGKQNIRHYREEICLLKRLGEYKAEHLRFLSDFECSFGNDAGERGAHYIKNKLRVAGGFRSDDGVKNHMVIASVLDTARKHKMNLHRVIRNAFTGVPIFPSG